MKPYNPYATAVAPNAALTEAGMFRTFSSRRRVLNFGVMKKIPTSTHGVLDYLVSGTLVLAPHLLGFPRGGPARIIPRLLGGFSAKYSALTDYELGVLKKLPMRSHLVLDVASGLILATSPWCMGFRGRRRSSWLPHVVVGAMEVAIAAMSQSKTPTRRAVERIRRANSNAQREVRSRVPSVA